MESKRSAQWNLISRWSGMVDCGDWYDVVDYAVCQNNDNELLLLVYLCVERPTGNFAVEAEGIINVEENRLEIKRHECHGNFPNDWMDHVKRAINSGHIDQYDRNVMIM